MTYITFRLTITSYYRGFRIAKTWDGPYIYPARSICIILGFISFLLILKDEENANYL